MLTNLKGVLDEKAVLVGIMMLIAVAGIGAIAQAVADKGAAAASAINGAGG